MLAVLRPREGGLRRGENFWLCLTTASAQAVFASLRVLFRLDALAKALSVIATATWLAG